MTKLMKEAILLKAITLVTVFRAACVVTQVKP